LVGQLDKPLGGECRELSVGNHLHANSEQRTKNPSQRKVNEKSKEKEFISAESTLEGSTLLDQRSK